MRRGGQAAWHWPRLAIGLVMLLGPLVLFGGAGTASAGSDLRLASAADGSLTVQGSGWPPGERLLVTLNSQVFPAFVDPAGDFEVRTGLALQGSGRPAVAVHRRVEEVDATPSPLGRLVAQGIVVGLAWLALLGIALGAPRLGRAVLRRRRGRAAAAGWAAAPRGSPSTARRLPLRGLRR